MSQQNMRTFERGALAFNRGDIDAILESFHPEVEWHAVFQVMFGGAATVCRGREDVRAYVQELSEGLTQMRLQLDEFRDLGERLIVIGRLEGRGRASGAVIDAPIVFVADYKEGLIFRMAEYLDPEKAFEAAGLRE
jgi:ketosteroid isomerase-like protein